MTYGEIRYEARGGVLTITLDRPGRLNAFTVRMSEELIDAFDRADADVTMTLGVRRHAGLLPMVARPAMDTPAHALTDTTVRSVPAASCDIRGPAAPPLASVDQSLSLSDD